MLAKKGKKLKVVWVGGKPKVKVVDIEPKKEARTINVEPNWEGLYRFMMHMKTTDKSAFSRVTNKMGPEWKKIVAMAEKNKWTESVNEWTVKQQKKYKIGTKMKPIKMGKTQRVTKDKKYRILTIRQWLKFPNYAHLTINRTHHIDTMVDGKLKQLPIVFVDKQDKVVKLEHVGENINELVPPMSVSNPAAYKAMLDKQIAKNVKVKTALGNKDHKDHKKAKSLYQRFMDKFKKKKDKPKKAAPKKQSKSDGDFYKRQFTGESIIEINGVKYNPLNEEASWGQVKTFLLGILRKKQDSKMDGFLVDINTANAILQVGNALNQSNQKKYGKLSIRKMASVAWKLVK